MDKKQGDEFCVERRRLPYLGKIIKNKMFRGKNNLEALLSERPMVIEKKKLEMRLKCDGTQECYYDFGAAYGSLPLGSRREPCLFTGQRRNHIWNNK